MKKIVILCTTIILIGVIWYFAIHSLSSEQPHKQSDIKLKEETSDDVTFEDEPAARALYEKMIETMRSAQTLSYKSTHRDVSDGEEYGRSSYTIWMKKPNLFYAEAINEDNNSKGILVGDGQYAWNFWPNGRPSFRGEDYDAYEKTRFNVYMKEPAPPGKYSIGYAVVFKKSNCFPILNPSIFQGINNTLEPIMDCVQGRGVEKVADEDCNVIEISYGNHQRSQYFWISIRDNLPRKLKDVVRANKDIITHEVWSEVTLNAEIPAEKFAWAPPENWRQWHPPGPEDKLLKPGQDAPDFELLSAAGGKIKLSDYLGKIVWIYIWRSGCPVCHEEVRHLQVLYEKYKDKGLVILGFNFSDDKKIALNFLRDNSATFPNILDASDEAIKTGFLTYGAAATPVNYVIDRKGKIVDAWIGYEKGHKQALTALEKAGLILESE